MRIGPHEAEHHLSVGSGGGGSGATAAAAGSYLPIVLWHGMGDSCCGDSMGAVTAAIQAALPGVFVHSIATGPPGALDVASSFFGSVDAQARHGRPGAPNNAVVLCWALGAGRGALGAGALGAGALLCPLLLDHSSAPPLPLPLPPHPHP